MYPNILFSCSGINSINSGVNTMSMYVRIYDTYSSTVIISRKPPVSAISVRHVCPPFFGQNQNGWEIDGWRGECYLECCEVVK